MVHAWPEADLTEMMIQQRMATTPHNFAEFIRLANPRYVFYPHVKLLLNVLDRVLDGSITRLMIFMPPRHFKSETVSRLFSAYYLLRYPYRWVGLASYGADLAYSLSRNARTNYQAVGGELRQAKAMRQWETYGGGGMWAAGVGGAATGKGFSLGIIDDPLKNAEEAASDTIRAKQQDWYRSVFTTRQAPDAAMILIQTRWHEQDLAGWLLAQEESEPEGWHILCMEAIKPAASQQFPPSCTVEVDPRGEGEALCPQTYPIDVLERRRGQLGSYFWSAMYDQRPVPPGGGLLKREWLPIVATPTVVAWRCRYWDKAASTTASAKYSAGVLIAITPQGRVIIEDVVRGQWGTNDRRQVMLQTAQLDQQRHPYGVVTYMEQEPGSSGLDSVNDEIRLLQGFDVHADRPSGDKDTRLRPFAAQAEAGNVELLQGAWNGAYIDEMAALPTGKYRDQADATAGAFNRMVESINAQPEGRVIYEEAVSISPY
jgi:predicted phage terminase large subunit-like protein